MGYAEKMQRLCALRGLDQSALAERMGISKSSMSRILSGAQEPKLRLAQDLARELGVTLDYLMDESADDPSRQPITVTEDELTVLKLVRRLGVDVAIDRLLGVEAPGRGAGGRKRGRRRSSRARSSDGAGMA
jgi:transcriptional regulator with XRE-family HTH domain